MPFVDGTISVGTPTFSIPNVAYFILYHTQTDLAKSIYKNATLEKISLIKYILRREAGEEENMRVGALRFFFPFHFSFYFLTLFPDARISFTC